MPIWLEAHALLFAQVRSALKEASAQPRAVVADAEPAKKPALAARESAEENRRVHVVVTADSNDYMHWQMLVCYHSYLKAAAAPGSPFSAFTRILHTGKADALMDVFPTVVVPEGPKPDAGAPPIQRPPALLAWLEAAPPAESFVLMLEPDHVLLRPVPLGSVARGKPAAYYFSYVSFEEHEAAFAPHLRRAGCALKSAARTGNSPSLMHVDDLRLVAPDWAEFSRALHDDKAVRDAVGWVGEMYGFALAACAVGLELSLRDKELMLHPPFDQELGEAAIIHYTYPNALYANGSVADAGKVPPEERFWNFDKRYVKKEWPRGRVGAPPQGAPASVVRLVEEVNEALEAAGWDWSMGKEG